MPKLFDRVKVNIATTGTGTVTFGSVASNAFLTPGEAGCADADTVRYVIVDGTDYEEGIGTIGGSVTTMARTTVSKSKIGGTAGTSKINLSGTAVLAFVASASDILNPANNLSELTNTGTAQTNLGGTTVGKAVFTATDAAAARAATGVDKIAPKGHLWGLTLSNNTSDSTHDIDIAAGEAADASGNLMKLASGLTKQIDAAWAVGTNQGGLDTGTVTTGFYSVHLIQRSDTGVVDVLFSLSAGGPTLPTNYDRFRRIGTLLYASGFKAFFQNGDVFNYKAALHDLTGGTVNASRRQVTMSVPSNTIAIFRANAYNSSSGAVFIIQPTSETDQSPAAGGQSLASEVANAGVAGHFQIPVDASSQIAVRADRASCVVDMWTFGWIDTRGRLG